MRPFTEQGAQKPIITLNSAKHPAGRNHLGAV